MNITVIGGRGKLGSVIAAHLANYFPVRVADKRGGEPTAEATRDADAVIVIVDTPSRSWGAYDVGNVVEACGQIDLSQYRLVVISSTVNPGDTEGAIKLMLEKSGKRAHVDFGLSYVPEFVRQGSVESDFAHPMYVVAGCVTDLERAAVCEVYETACGVKPTFMSIPSAEIMKLGLNTTITAKLAKANEIAWLCQHTPGANARDVLDAIKRDPRVSPLYFGAGPPPGGPCFPRDNAAFGAAAFARGVPCVISHAVSVWERWQFSLMADLVDSERVGIAGLSFKPGHVDATESPGIRLAEYIDAETYDPDLPSTCDSLAELLDKCDTIVIAMPFEGVQDLLELDVEGKTIWDWWGLFGDTFRRFGRADPV